MGLGGQTRVPGSRDPRIRRNADNLSSNLSAFILSPGSGIGLNSGGQLILVFASGEPFTQATGLALTLDANSGLTKSASALKLDLGTNSGLLLTANKLNLDLASNSGLLLTTNKLALDLAANSGLLLTANKLAIDLDTTPALQLLANKLSVLLDPTEPGLQRTSGLKVLLDASEPGLQLTSGLKVLLATDPALELSSGLRVKIKASGGVVRDSDGLSVSAATSAVAGSVLSQTLVNDVTVLTDSSGGTSGAGTIAAIGVTITDPADTPADADALRDDLVANTIPDMVTRITELRDAVATLAAYCTTLEDKINEMIAAQKTAGQMNTV